MPGTSRRGFALMNPERQREIARKGGRAAHEKGTAHQFTPDEAREAGRKGGVAVSHNRDHMVEIGRSGGRARRRPRQADDQAADASQPGNEGRESDVGPDGQDRSERISDGAANGQSARSEAESAPSQRDMMAADEQEV